MKFRNYCVIVMKTTDGIIEDIKRICESTPNFLDAKGIVITTFTSAIEPNELNDWLKLNNRNYLFFELTDETSGFNFLNQKIHNELFGFLNDQDLDKKQEDFLREIKESSNIKKSSSRTRKVVSSPREYVLTEEDIKGMNKQEKRDLCNKLIDNGVENLTENDKKILEYLVK